MKEKMHIFLLGFDFDLVSPVLVGLLAVSDVSDRIRENHSVRVLVSSRLIQTDPSRF